MLFYGYGSHCVTLCIICGFAGFFVAFIYILKCGTFSLVAMHAMWINACGAGGWDSTLDGGQNNFFLSSYWPFTFDSNTKL